jgi:hypothetical protein
MAETLDITLFKSIPEELIGKIFEYTVHNERLVQFDYYHPKTYSNNYSYKYEVAYIRGMLVKDRNGNFLSVMKKPNGKHRYYITTETEEWTPMYYDEIAYYDSMDSLYLRYTSKFIGTDLQEALLYFA